MREKYIDAMAIVRELGKPSLFVTMTCNPRWPEIQQSLPYGSRAEDHPEIVARVFNLKLKALMADLTEHHVLGITIGHMMVVEFQYRGLPHAHILLIMRSDDRITNADAVDGIVSAELPPVDVNLPQHEIENRNHLRSKVLEHMLHNDCRVMPDCRCRRGGVCRFGFPKPFVDRTVWSDDQLYPVSVHLDVHVLRDSRPVVQRRKCADGRAVSSRLLYVQATTVGWLTTGVGHSRGTRVDDLIVMPVCAQVDCRLQPSLVAQIRLPH